MIMFLILMISMVDQALILQGVRNLILITSMAIFCQAEKNLQTTTAYVSVLIVLQAPIACSLPIHFAFPPSAYIKTVTG